MGENRNAGHAGKTAYNIDRTPEPSYSDVKPLGLLTGTDRHTEKGCNGLTLERQQGQSMDGTASSSFHGSLVRRPLADIV